MNKITHAVSYSLLFVAMVLGFVSFADAQPNNREVRDALRSLSSRIDDFEFNLRYQMESSSDANTSLGDVSSRIRELRDSVREFEENFNRRRENRDDANKIIASARRVDEFLKTDQQNRRVEDDWKAIRRQIERLSSHYGVTVNW